MRRGMCALALGSMSFGCGGAGSNGTSGAADGSSGGGGATGAATSAGDDGGGDDSTTSGTGSMGAESSTTSAAATDGGDTTGTTGGGGESSTGADTDADGKTYRNSLSICWTDPSCQRAFAIAHGGLWDLNAAPYDSDAAIAAAYDADVDGVKIDVRVTMDNVPVIAHSSPIEYWESLDCGGQYIEEMMADEVTQCHRLPSATETFQRLDDVLEYIRGKMVAQLTVKLSSDYARTIEQVHTQQAEDFAFLEISTTDLADLIPTIDGSGDIYYLIEIGSSLGEVDTLIDTIANPQAFMYEFDPTVDVSSLTPDVLHPAGIRSFTYTNAPAPSVAELQALFDNGYDVVSSQAADHGVTARIAVNTANGVTPP